MNERLMQFRIGMFVIVAGLVLTMMIVWFGESPSVFRDQVYLKVHYAEAPGVVEGVPVRKSGIRIGEVFATEFDERPNEPDGVIVTLALERRYPLHEGTVPRLNRSLIGDVTVDMMPGTGHCDSADRASCRPRLRSSRARSRPIRPRPSPPRPRPSRVPATRLKSINVAAAGLGQDHPRVPTSSTTSSRPSPTPARTSPRSPRESTGSSRPTRVTCSRRWPISARSRASSTKPSIRPPSRRASTGSLPPSARLDADLALIDPVLKDLSSPVNHQPTTDIGQAVPANQSPAPPISSSLTSKLRDGRGRPQHEGSLQKLLTQAELHDNFNAMAVAATQTLIQLKTVSERTIRSFVDKVSRDPSVHHARRVSPGSRRAPRRVDLPRPDSCRLSTPRSAIVRANSSRVLTRPRSRRSDKVDLRQQILSPVRVRSMRKLPRRVFLHDTAKLAAGMAALSAWPVRTLARGRQGRRQARRSQ